MDASLKARKALERELRQAIEQGDLELHYQPQVDLRTGRIGGVEALLRWPHKSRGMIPPVSFIPLAESTGLIRPLGAWILAEAGRAARRWRDLGLELEVAVNLSAAQLRNQEIVGLVARVLADNDLTPQALELELTESLFVDPSEIALRRALERVAEMGVQLAIDDFGTGYSSLAYLKRLPVSKIKIDRSFLAEIGRERADEALVRAIIGLAKTFGKRVLAEGVETEAQRQFLLREGCDAAQGYLFSRPVGEDAVTAMLIEDRRRHAPTPLRIARVG
jgi:EAL domain-containing protein (putative c-di-GMP-specific phosphodiesterase class I)